MKTTLKKIRIIGSLLIITMLLQTNGVFAQQGQQHRYGQKGNNKGGNREKIEAQRVAFITQELNLTPEEAQVFWPVYNEYDAKRHDLMKSFKDANNIHKDEIENLSDKDAEQMLDNQIIEAQKLLDLRKEYHGKFKAVLPAKKVLQLYDSEREFQKMLIDRLRQHNPPAQSGNK
jgi:hypothetical protein